MAEQKYSMYDPSVDAFREVSRTQAEAFIESAKEVEKAIKRDDKAK